MPLGTQKRALEEHRDRRRRLLRPVCPTSTTLQALLGVAAPAPHRLRLGRGLRSSFSNLICRASASQSRNDFMTRKIARLSQSVRALSAPLTIFNSQPPLDRCLATNQASACLIPVSGRSKPSRDNESSDDKRSVNLNGYENFVQKKQRFCQDTRRVERTARRAACAPPSPRMTLGVVVRAFAAHERRPSRDGKTALSDLAGSYHPSS